MSSKQPDLLGFDRSAWRAWLAAQGEPAYKAGQIVKWIHARGETDCARMHDLSKRLRAKLAAAPRRALLERAEVIAAADGTRKYLYEAGGSLIEAVWIPEQRRRTLCLSSQAGCALGCTFCYTGRQGFAHNLTAAQIIGQFRDVAADTHAHGPISNVVFMGMGEPLLNLDAVAPVLRLLTDDLCYGLSRRRVTVSTVGVVPGIERLREEAPVALAVSLHAPRDDLRSEIVPLNRRYPLAQLLEACARYLEKAPRDFITFEYALLERVNDDIALAADLAKLLARVPGKINLIPFNPFPGSAYRAPSRNRVMAFRDALKRKGLVATIRRQRGSDILAACGQLAGRVDGRTPAGGRIAIPLAPAR